MGVVSVGGESVKFQLSISDDITDFDWSIFFRFHYLTKFVD